MRRSIWAPYLTVQIYLERKTVNQNKFVLQKQTLQCINQRHKCRMKEFKEGYLFLWEQTYVRIKMISCLHYGLHWGLYNSIMYLLCILYENWDLFVFVRDLTLTFLRMCLLNHCNLNWFGTSTKTFLKDGIPHRKNEIE